MLVHVVIRPMMNNLDRKCQWQPLMGVMPFSTRSAATLHWSRLLSQYKPLAELINL
jgi:hypothetical protein